MKRPLDLNVLAVTAVGVFVLLAALSFTATGLAWNYLLGVLVIVEIYALLALGLSLEFGHTGLLNFGHVAFMGIGAYAMGILVRRLEGDGGRFSGALAGLTFPGAVAVAVLVLVVGALVAVPALFAAQRWLPARWSSKAKTAVGLGGGALAAAIAFAASFPLSEDGALTATVLLAVLAGVLLAALAALAVGLPAVRLREDYLAIAAIGFAEIMQKVYENEDRLTNGTLGLVVHRPVARWAGETTWFRDFARGLDLQPSYLAHALLGLLAVAYALAVLQWLARSPWGRVLKAIREDDEVAAALGKNVLAAKLQSLMIGSALAALAGVLAAWWFGSVYPGHFPKEITFFALIMVIVGGLANHVGAVVGSLVMWGVYQFALNLTLLERFGLRNIAGPPEQIVVGLLLITVMVLRPQGILGRKEELAHVR